MKTKKKVRALIEADVIIIEQENGDIELIETIETHEFIETLKEIEILDKY